MHIARRRLAQWTWAALVALVGCGQGTRGDVGDAMTREAGTGPIAYTPAPADGGACPLEVDIAYNAHDGVDGFLRVALELRAPATIWQQRLRIPGPGTVDCVYPAPACGDPSLPDFADVRAMLAQPEIVAWLARAPLRFGPSWMVSNTTTLGIGPTDARTTIAVVNGLPRCSTLDDDAGVEDCVPDEIAQLFALIESFKTIRHCD